MTTQPIPLNYYSILSLPSSPSCQVAWMKMRIRCSGTRRNHMSTRRLPLRSRTTKKLWVLHGDGMRQVEGLLDNITWLYDNKLIDTAVIVAPKGVYRNWEVSEIPTHLPENIQPEVYVWSANQTRVNVKDCRRVLIRHGLFAYCSSMSKHLERRKGASISGTLCTRLDFPTCGR